MRLFHFSDDPGIAVFTPRPVLVPSDRGPGLDWLNGPLVWAVTEARQATYFFPRDCPRILLWPKSGTTPEDLDRWFSDSGATMVAYVEEAWAGRVLNDPIYRYDLPTGSFEMLHDPGSEELWMAVSREAVTPLSIERLDIPAAMREAKVELRVVDRLTPLRGVWDTSLHASGIRLRNAQDWT